MSEQPPPPPSTPPPPPPPPGGWSAVPPPSSGQPYGGPPPGPPPGPSYGASPTGQPTGGSGAGPGVWGLRPGELLDRFVARVIDHVLLGVVNAILVAIIVVGAIGLDGGTLGFGGSVAAGAVSAVLSTAIGLGYFGLMETSQGRTVGKMVMKLRVQGASGSNPTWEESLRRNIWMALPLAGVVPVLGGLIAGLGQLVAVILIAVGINKDTARRRPWTDTFAGTQVVKEA